MITGREKVEIKIEVSEGSWRGKPTYRYQHRGELLDVVELAIQSLKQLQKHVEGSLGEE